MGITILNCGLLVNLKQRFQIWAILSVSVYAEAFDWTLTDHSLNKKKISHAREKEIFLSLHRKNIAFNILDNCDRKMESDFFHIYP